MGCLELVVSILNSTKVHVFDDNHLGRHCCLWCLITSGSMIVPRAQRGRSPSRTLDSIKADHLSFCTAGSDLHKAKLHNNVIGTNIFDIAVDQVRLYCIGRLISLHSVYTNTQVDGMAQCSVIR
jgi:hypothetical protein